MPRKRPRRNIKITPSSFYDIYDSPDDTSPYIKNSFRLIFGLLLFYVILSLTLGPKQYKTETVTDIHSQIYRSTGRRGGGSPSLVITLSTNLSNEYYISTQGNQPFKVGDTILVFSNMLKKNIGVTKGNTYYSLDKLSGLLILLIITSLFGFVYSIFGDFRIKVAIFIIITLNSWLLYLYLNE